MDVYIFGAGASAAEGAPATDEFFAEAWRLLGPAFDPRLTAVWHFLEEVFERPVTGPGDFAHIPALDQVFSLVDWSLHADQGLGAQYDPPRLYQVRRDLEHLVCSTLGAALEQGGRRGVGPHARFARGLLERGSLGHRFALLSLNYDTLLDNALAAEGAAPDYGFGDRDLASLCQRPLLLKLHGSLNWVVCKACDHLEAVRGEVAHLLPQVGGLHCRRCGCERLHGLIISPTWLKSYGAPQLRHVWDLALECVQQAERIVFAGYSLPEADVAIFHLLCRGLLTRRAGQRPQLEVINHREGIEHHFRRLFGSDVKLDLTGFHGQV